MSEKNHKPLEGLFSDLSQLGTAMKKGMICYCPHAQASQPSEQLTIHELHAASQLLCFCQRHTSLVQMAAMVSSSSAFRLAVLANSTTPPADWERSMSTPSAVKEEEKAMALSRQLHTCCQQLEGFWFPGDWIEDHHIGKGKRLLRYCHLLVGALKIERPSYQILLTVHLEKLKQQCPNEVNVLGLGRLRCLHCPIDLAPRQVVDEPDFSWLLQTKSSAQNCAFRRSSYRKGPAAHPDATSSRVFSYTIRSTSSSPDELHM